MVDTNVVAYMLLPGPHTALVDDMLILQPEWAAPPLWRSEWCNVLAGYLSRGDLNLDQALAPAAAADHLVIHHEEPVSSEAVLQLVASSR